MNYYVSSLIASRNSLHLLLNTLINQHFHSGATEHTSASGLGCYTFKPPHEFFNTILPPQVKRLYLVGNRDAYRVLIRSPEFLSWLLHHSRYTCRDLQSQDIVLLKHPLPFFRPHLKYYSCLVEYLSVISCVPVATCQNVVNRFFAIRGYPFNILNHNLANSDILADLEKLFSMAPFFSIVVHDYIGKPKDFPVQYLHIMHAAFLIDGEDVISLPLEAFFESFSKATTRVICDNEEDY